MKPSISWQRDERNKCTEDTAPYVEIEGIESILNKALSCLCDHCKQLFEYGNNRGQHVPIKKCKFKEKCEPEDFVPKMYKTIEKMSLVTNVTEIEICLYLVMLACEKCENEQMGEDVE